MTSVTLTLRMEVDGERAWEIVGWAEAEDGGFLCDGCREMWTAAEPPPKLYECDCGSIYSRENSADGDSHRCPDCGKFGRVLCEHGCEDCGEALEARTIAQCPECEEWFALDEEFGQHIEMTHNVVGAQ